MKPTAYILFFVSLVLAFSAVLVYRNPEQVRLGTDNLPGGPESTSILAIALAVAAAGAAGVAFAILRFGGKGYTETNTPPARR